jgi:hypothetical protein
MEKTNPPCPLTVAGEEEKLNPQYKKKLGMEKPLFNLLEKLIENN